MSWAAFESRLAPTGFSGLLLCIVTSLVSLSSSSGSPSSCYWLILFILQGNNNECQYNQNNFTKDSTDSLFHFSTGNTFSSFKCVHSQLKCSHSQMCSMGRETGHHIQFKDATFAYLDSRLEPRLKQGNNQKINERREWWVKMLA